MSPSGRAERSRNSTRSIARRFLCLAASGLFLLLALLPFFHWVLLPGLANLRHPTTSAATGSPVLHPLPAGGPPATTDACPICTFFTTLLRVFLPAAAAGVLGLIVRRMWLHRRPEQNVPRSQFSSVQPRSPPVVALPT